jgi:hypothetical protein
MRTIIVLLATLFAGCAASKTTLDLERYRFISLSYSVSQSGIPILMAIFDNPETPEPVDLIAFWRAEGGELLGVSYRRDGKIYLWDIQTQTEQEVTFETPRKTSPDSTQQRGPRSPKQQKENSTSPAYGVAPSFRQPSTGRNCTNVVAGMEANHRSRS